MGRLFAINKMAEGPFPEHYEPIETPLGTNPLHPNVVSNPVVRLYEQDALRMGKKEQFPYVGTTYRLTEHFHTRTKARIAQRNCSAGTVCGNQRNAGGGERHCQWRSCHCLQQAWLYPRGGCGNAPSETAECKRSAG